jgi:hypothetical protein
MSGRSLLDLSVSRASLLVLQSSAAQSSLPLLKWAVDRHPPRAIVVLCSLLYPPQALASAIGKSDNILAVDCTGAISGYGTNGGCNHREVILEAVDAGEQICYSWRGILAEC